MIKAFKFLIFTSWVVMLGCDNKLDIKPEDTLVETDVFAEEALAERALGEAYLQLARASVNTTFTLADFTTDITESNDNEFFNKFIDGNLRPQDETIADFWLSYYSAINSANGLITNIPRFGTYDQEIQSQHVGEAKFVRAFAYLKLLCLYGEGALTKNMAGMGLPLQLTPFAGYNEDDELLPRSTVQQVYDQIIKDLKEAAEAVPQSYGTSSSANLDNRTRVTKGGAHALLSRTYLYMGDFEEAADYAQLVIDQVDTYELTQDITELFPDNTEVIETNMTKEYILGYPFSFNQMGSNNVSFSYYFKLSLWVDENFVNAYPPEDLRIATLIFEGDTENNQHIVEGRRTTAKYSHPFGRDNVPMIRLAEVMLTRAEALARTGGVNQESIHLLNTVHQRSNPTADDLVMGDFADSQQLIDEILRERKLELAFEGHARYDLMRTDQPLRNPNVSQDHKILPIPQLDIDISKGVIKQNPGY
ncbi:RagB/SusD family nutrient uptake outer membrane protein [Fulvivirga sp. M361]|uniref:RagB/SusD family nutrient uptake outer membrane protein n=1 Tax=Fulvivirga sp. M361 TaxID=2594266 RepID=UPI001179B419|nr:RagB/SusD family nutrient uptake outer membrane protein [Fulvivirga sp. M361]TRX60183.1 RagB/SusD family nutrient uptake outer membrane protein [Fulvivirga sp. M361]